MSDEDEALKNAKLQHRATKASLMRLGKAAKDLCKNKRPASEVSEYLVKVKTAFENVASKHEIYDNLILDDKPKQVLAVHKRTSPARSMPKKIMHVSAV